MSERVFIDTGAWVALALRDDAHHTEAEVTFPRLLGAGIRFVTTNYVAGETYTFLARVRDTATALAFLDRLGASVALDYIHVDEATEARARDWLKRFHDHRLSYVDAVSFAVMQEMGLKKAFAFDRHFEVAGFERIG